MSDTAYLELAQNTRLLPLKFYLEEKFLSNASLVFERYILGTFDLYLRIVVTIIKDNWGTEGRN
ncbi:MAG: hypothetical protein IPO98_13405 [Saprospiraceae bacterium]|nr:hypothetical protein [Saprospiraceae bacterium]